MNLLSIQDDLKNVSDQDLVRMMQSPDSTAPSYLVLSEIRRRKDVRTRAGDTPDRTVAEDLVDTPQTYSDQQGIRGLRVPGYEEEQQVNDADSGAGIEAMRAGGVVRMADGGEAEIPLPPPATPMQQYAARGRPIVSGRAPDDINMQDMMQRNMELIPGIPEELMNRLREGRTNEPERRREAQNNALIEAGLRIASSNNPRLAGAIGEGALPAVQGYNQQRAQIRQDQRAELQQEMTAAQADIQRRYMAGQLSAAEYRSAMSEAGANRRSEMQLAQSAAQHGASQGAAESRFERQLAAETAARAGRGELSPQEFNRLSEPEKQAFREMQDIRRPRNADVSGLATASGPLGVRLNALRTELSNLGPPPAATTGFLGRENPALAAYNENKNRLTQEYAFVNREYQNAIGAVTAPRASAARAGAGSVATQADPLGLR